MMLPDPIRLTILLRYMQGMSPTEIADATETPLASVKTRLRRGLERLRSHFDDTHDGRENWKAAFLILGSSTSTAPLLPVPGSSIPARQTSSTATGSSAAIWITALAAAATVLIAVSFAPEFFAERSPSSAPSTELALTNPKPESRDSASDDSRIDKVESIPTPSNPSAAMIRPLTVTIVDEEGQPVDLAAVTTIGTDGPPVLSQDGRVVIDLGASVSADVIGQTTLKIRHPEFVPKTLAVLESQTSVNVTLRIGQKFRVRVTAAATGDPIAGARVRNQSSHLFTDFMHSLQEQADSQGILVEELVTQYAASPSTAQISPATDTTAAVLPQLPADFDEVRTGQDGFAEFTVPLDASAYLECSAEGYAPHFEIIENLEEPAEIQMHVGGQLIVKRDGAFEGLPLSLKVGEVHGAMSADQTEYTFCGLPPGQYLLIAVATDPEDPTVEDTDPSSFPMSGNSPIHELALLSTSVLDFTGSTLGEGPHELARSLQSRVRSRWASIPPGTTSIVSLVERGVDFDVTLHGERGHLVSNAQLAIQAMNEETVAVATNTGTHYSFQSIEPGDYQLQILQANEVPVTRPIRVVSNTTTVRVELGDAVVAIHSTGLLRQVSSTPESQVLLPGMIVAEVIVRHLKSGAIRHTMLHPTGETRIGGLPTGPAQIWIVTPSHALRTQLRLRAGEQSWTPALAHDPSFRVELSIVDERGHPIDADVKLSPRGLQTNQRFGITLTNAQFSYRPDGAQSPPESRLRSVWEVPSAVYKVHIHTAGSPVVTSEIEVNGHLKRTIQLDRPKPVQLTVLRDGAPASELFVQIHSHDKTRRWQTGLKTDQRGQAPLRLSPGDYWLIPEFGKPTKFTLDDTHSSVSVEVETLSPQPPNSSRTSTPR